MHKTLFTVTLFVLSVGLTAGVAWGDTVVQPTNLLLPEPGVIYSPSPAGVTFGNGITLTAMLLDSPSSQTAPPGGLGTVSSFFDIWVEFSLDVSPAGPGPFTNPAAPAGVRYTNVYSGWPISQYATELLSLDLSGGGGGGGMVMIRESPTRASTGGTTITEVAPGGPYAIDSFFDVFFELSLDGGQTWSPASDSLRLTTAVPEPATLTLLGLGLATLVARRRRR